MLKLTVQRQTSGFVFFSVRPSQLLVIALQGTDTYPILKAIQLGKISISSMNTRPWNSGAKCRLLPSMGSKFARPVYQSNLETRLTSPNAFHKYC